jgi:hypothetical protein
MPVQPMTQTAETSDAAERGARAAPAERVDHAGALRFVSIAASVRERTAMLSERALVVSLDRLGPAARGRLADVIDEAIDRELSARGAAAPGIGSACDPDATLSDQLFRARQVGARAICVALGSLHAICSPRGALEVEDGETLRFLASATRERPLWLLVDDESGRIGTYTALAPLASVLAPSPPAELAAVAPAPPPAPEPEPAPVIPDSTPTPPLHSAGAATARPSDEWRHWTLQLTAARGPQSLAAFERIFAESYVPLSQAIEAGLDDPRAKSAEADFRHGFEKSYTDAFATFAVTGKRPKMVLDAPDIAGRIARLHGARATQLLLVDSMRWDVGQLVKDRLVHLFGSRASLTDELILWAALPTTTARQLESLARGIDALKRPPEAPGDVGAESLRGKTAEVVRRIKLGRRDLFKLDVLEARLRESREGKMPMADAAETVAKTIARYSETLSPRTLLFVFGDHGFRMKGGQREERPSASPEEVIVPAFAFFVGEVH